MRELQSKIMQNMQKRLNIHLWVIQSLTLLIIEKKWTQPGFVLKNRRTFQTAQ